MSHNKYLPELPSAESGFITAKEHGVVLGSQNVTLSAAEMLLSHLWFTGQRCNIEKS